MDKHKEIPFYLPVIDGWAGFFLPDYSQFTNLSCIKFFHDYIDNQRTKFRLLDDKGDDYLTVKRHFANVTA